MNDAFHKWLRVPYTLHAVVRAPRGKRTGPTVVFLHGIGNSGTSWDEILTQLPESIKVITVDLLGFGQSPKPGWVRYDAKTQARSVVATLLARGKLKPVILVGHSLGALVAVEIVKSYPYLVKSLVLCSPPFYVSEYGAKRLLPRSDKVLRRIYGSVQHNPDRFVRMSQFAIRYKLVHESFNVTSENIDIYMAALEAMIINQTSYEDVHAIKKSMRIIRGSFDPFVVGSNLRKLQKKNPYVSIQTVAAAHEMRGRLIKPIARAIERALTPKTSRSKV